MSTTTVNNYPVLTSISSIVKKGTAAAHADGQARQLYLEAFISAFAHAHDHGDNTIVTTIYDLMPKHSSYKSKVKKWVETFTPLEYSNSQKCFVVKKLDDGSKDKWYMKAIRAAHSNPFYAKQEKVEVLFDADKQLKSLQSKLTKMVKDFEANMDATDIETVASLKLMLDAVS